MQYDARYSDDRNEFSFEQAIRILFPYHGNYFHAILIHTIDFHIFSQCEGVFAMS